MLWKILSQKKSLNSKNRYCQIANLDQLCKLVYRLAHGCSYSTVGDLFEVASSTACQIFNEVIRVIV